MKAIKKIMLTSVAVLTLDAIWIYFVAKPLYDAYFTLQLSILAGILAYIAILIGIIVVPKDKPIRNGLLIGAAMYGTYGFTNAALFGYPLWIALTDVAWGAILCAAGCYVYKKS